MNAKSVVDMVAENTISEIQKLKKPDYIAKCIAELEENRTEFELGGNHDALSFHSNNGIYVFWANFKDSDIEWSRALEVFSEIWNEQRKQNGITHYPKVIKNRAIHSFQKNKNNWIPIYLGKAKKVKTRVIEHIKNGAESTTFALKLEESKDLFSTIKFSVSTLDFGLLDDSYYLCEIVESVLRNELNPIIGRQ